MGLAKFSSLPVHFSGGVTGTSTTGAACAKGASERIGAVEIVGATIDGTLDLLIAGK